MEFNEQIMRLRKREGWSQEELGFKLNVTRQTIFKWETGDTTPEMEKLILLSRLFDISTDELLMGKALASPTDSARAGYEYKSSRTFYGLPLVHINIGSGKRRAKGIVAVGNMAIGVFSVGGVSAGVVSVGALSLGLVSLGAVVLGLMSMGAVASGFLALGGVAMGQLAFGGVALGDYAVGGVAVAQKIALGGYAQGVLAFGEEARGTVALSGNPGIPDISAYELRSLIYEHLPETKTYIIELFARLLK